MKLLFLKTDQDFDKNRFRKFISSSTIRIRVAPANQNQARFGFIIPKKVLPKVTDRNRVKRRIKTILSRNLVSIKPADIIIFPQAKSLKLEFQSLETEVITGLKRLNLWKF